MVSRVAGDTSRGGEIEALGSLLDNGVKVTLIYGIYQSLGLLK
jgi:hypothetical protein